MNHLSAFSAKILFLTLNLSTILEVIANMALFKFLLLKQLEILGGKVFFDESK